jgi:histone acetyltransferase (RNA polymerase elongator complex component)
LVKAILAPSSIEALREAHTELKDGLQALVKVAPAMLDNPLECVDISLPRRSCLGPGMCAFCNSNAQG